MSSTSTMSSATLLARALRHAALLAAMLTAGAGPALAQPTTCEIDRPVVFAGLDYDSAAFHTALARLVIEKGYGCRTDRIPGAVIPLVNGVARGDIDITMEIWLANPVEAWVTAERAGKVVRLGTTFPDATEGWFVPRYLVEGPQAPAPDLKSVADLARHAALFRDPDQPAKGRFYNCVPGWQCEIVNSKKLVAYGLADSFVNVRPGSGDALNAAIDGAIRRRQPVVFYHWSPSWLTGAHDPVRLEEPPFDATVWAAMLAADKPARATAYPVSRVVIGANAGFANAAPRIAAFLTAYGTSAADTSKALAEARAAGTPAEAMAPRFLREREDVWSRWVPADVAVRLRAAR